MYDEHDEADYGYDPYYESVPEHAFGPEDEEVDTDLWEDEEDDRDHHSYGNPQYADEDFYEGR